MANVDEGKMKVIIEGNSLNNSLSRKTKKNAKHKK